jgi:cytochrome c553
MSENNMMQVVSVAVALLFASGASVAGPDIVKGKAKADAVCAACHGPDGSTPIDPSYPRLGGQHRDFLERALLDYQKESRKNAIMVGQAKQLSRKDIADISAYYSQLPGQLTLKPAK